MILTKLSLNEIDYILNAQVSFGETFDGKLNGMLLAGVYNDGKNYKYTDKNGNTYTKNGNTVSISSKITGESISQTLTEGKCARFKYSTIGVDEYLGISINDMPSTSDFDRAKVRAASIYNNADAVSKFISENYKDALSFSCLGVSSNNYFGVWVAKNEYPEWANSTMSINWVYSGPAHGLLKVDLTGVYSSGPMQPSDPYEPGGSSETGGGTGTFDRTGDDIGVPSLPTLSAVSTGFVTLYNPTLGQLNDLASYMWSDLFDINTFKKIFADPMDVILGLSIVPVSVPDGGSVDVKVGNISTGVTMNKAASQFVHVSCGSLEIKEYWGAYLDFAPYTKAEIYLPYCGSHPIDIDEIMGKTISVDYNIDIFSGACCAMIKCGNSVLYHFLGQCSQSIPISGNDWSQFISNAIRAAASIGTMVATAGASAPATAAGSLARTTSQISSGASTAESIVSMKPSIEKSGAMCGCGGMLGVQTPYITFNFPRQCLPTGQNTIIGYPTYITYTLGDLSGYTIVDDLRLTIDTATNQEKDEIEELLKGGVIL